MVAARAPDEPPPLRRAVTAPPPLEIAADAAARLGALIDALPDGASVTLGRGTFALTAPLRLSRGLFISGAGMGLTLLTAAFATDEPLIIFSGPSPLHLEHLALSAPPDRPRRLLVVLSGAIDVQQCRFVGSEQAAGLTLGVRLQSAARATLSRCRFEGLDVGVEVADQASALISNGRFTGGGCGLRLEGQSHGACRNSQIVGARRDGVMILGDATLDVERVSFDGNRAGIGAGDRGRVEARQCRLSTHRRAGVHLEGQSRALLLGCRFKAEPVGLEVTEAATAILKEGRVKGGALGALITSTANVEIAQVTFEAQVKEGLRVEAPSSPTIRANTFEGQGRASIAWSGRGECSDNVIVRVNTGIVVADAAAPLLSGNRIHDSRHHGILIKDEATPTLVGNQIVGAQRAGLSIKGAARPTASGNTIEGGAVGILVEGRASPILIQNHLLNLSEFGLRFGDSAAGRAEANTIVGCGVGIGAFDHARPLLRRNACRQSLQAGIHARDSSSALIEANICIGAPLGLKVGAGASPLLRFNQLTDNTQDYDIPPNLAPDARLTAPAPVPRRDRTLNGPRHALRLADQWPALLALTTSLASALALAPTLGWTLGAALAASLASGGAALGVWAGLRRWRLLTRGLLIDGVVVRHDPALGQLTVGWRDLAGADHAQIVRASPLLVDAHRQGVEVPVLIDPDRPDRASFPSLEGVRFLHPPEIEDRRPPIDPSSGASLDPPAGWSVEATLYRAPIDPFDRGRWLAPFEARVGALRFTEEAVELVDSGRPRPRIALIQPFVVHVTAWLLAGGRAEVCVSIRQRSPSTASPTRMSSPSTSMEPGGVAHAGELAFAVELPQARVDRGIPLHQRSAPFIRASDLDAIWPVLRAIARIHGERLPPL